MTYETMAFSRTNTLLAALFVALLATAGAACGGGDDGDDGDGGSGGDGGGGSGSGGSGGASGGSSGGDALQRREVKNCSKAPTVGQVEQRIIQSKCATAGCHRDDLLGNFRYNASKSWAPDFFDAEASQTCNGDKIFDKEDPENSLFYRIIQENPECAGSGNPKNRMPPSNALSQLTDEEKTCIEEYVRAVTAD